MKSKQLEKYFFDYQKTLIKRATEVEGAVLLGEEEFHINAKNKTIFIKDMGILEYVPNPNVSGDGVNVAKEEWLALVKVKDASVPNASVIQYIVGSGNPYDDVYKAVLPTDDGRIIATPKTIIMQLLKSKVKT